MNYGLGEENWAFCTDPEWKTSCRQFLPAARRKWRIQRCK